MFIKIYLLQIWDWIIYQNLVAVLPWFARTLIYIDADCELRCTCVSFCRRPYHLRVSAHTLMVSLCFDCTTASATEVPINISILFDFKVSPSREVIYSFASQVLQVLSSPQPRFLQVCTCYLIMSKLLMTSHFKWLHRLFPLFTVLFRWVREVIFYDASPILLVLHMIRNIIPSATSTWRVTYNYKIRLLLITTLDGSLFDQYGDMHIIHYHDFLVLQEIVDFITIRFDHDALGDDFAINTIITQSRAFRMIMKMVAKPSANWFSYRVYDFDWYLYCRRLIFRRRFWKNISYLREYYR